MRTIKLDGKAEQLPESWPDVAPEKIPELLQLIYFGTNSPADSHELIRTALQIPLKRWRAMMQKHFGPGVRAKTKEANAVVLHELKHALKWMYLEPIHHQPFPKIEMDFGLELLLPEADFLTMSYGELTDAYIHFLVYIRQLIPGNQHLDLLVATLCRPERATPGRTGDYQNSLEWDGDHREPYNEFTAKERAKLVALLEPGYKMAVLLFFAGNMQRVLDRYALFADGDGEPEEYPGQGWVKNSHLMASKNIFGSINQVKAANLHDVLLFLEENKKDLLAEIEQHKQQQEA
jgi:hypothetical protein